MKGFENNSTDTRPIEEWTLEECREFLKKYPKTLKADRINERINKLKPTGASKETTTSTTTTTTNTSTATTTPSYNPSKPTKSIWDEILETGKFIVVLLLLGFMGLMIYGCIAGRVGWKAISLPFIGCGYLLSRLWD